MNPLANPLAWLVPVGLVLLVGACRLALSALRPVEKDWLLAGLAFVLFWAGCFLVFAPFFAP